MLDQYFNHYTMDPNTIILNYGKFKKKNCKKIQKKNLTLVEPKILSVQKEIGLDDSRQHRHHISQQNLIVVSFK